jgi:hypothetical protein
MIPHIPDKPVLHRGNVGPIDSHPRTGETRVNTPQGGISTLRQIDFLYKNNKSICKVLKVKVIGVDFLPQGLPADPEDFGGLGAIALGELDDPDDMILLRLRRNLLERG